MNPPASEGVRLRTCIGAVGSLAGARFLADSRRRLAMSDLEVATALPAGAAMALRGRSVLVATASQMATVLSLIALDGVARRLVLCPPDLDPAHLPDIARLAAIEAIVLDANSSAALRDLDRPLVMCCPATLIREDTEPEQDAATEWVLFTSGTTSRPKMVVHDLASLSAALSTVAAIEQGDVWSTFYDIRRYGGLQMLPARACWAASSLVLSQADEPVRRLSSNGSARGGGDAYQLGTPSHWRQALMSAVARRTLAAALRAALRRDRRPGRSSIGCVRRFRILRIAHAYASTEAGVGVQRRGWPRRLSRGFRRRAAGRGRDRACATSSLHIRSVRHRRVRYLGAEACRRSPRRRTASSIPATCVEGPRGAADRLRSVGGSGLINVGGAKVQPEEVEDVLNRHPLRRRWRGFAARPQPDHSAPSWSADLVLHGPIPAGSEDKAALSAEIIAAVP